MLTVDYSIKSLKQFFVKEKPSQIVLVTSLFLLSKLDWEIKELQRITKQKVTIITIPNGEMAKEWNSLEKLLKQFIKHNLDRNSLVLALGGGSVTDAVGFACSIYKRGVKYINIPTTLLGIVDASIGGKTAINFSGYKNQIGSFYHPLATIIDVRFLKSLSNDQIIDGFAEIIKAGFIKDATLFKTLESKNLVSLAKSSQIQSIIEKSIKVKNYFTNQDAGDRGVRQILNFGHTIGHAVELQHGISHGKAVFVGMLKELEVGERLKITDPRVRVRLEKILEKNNIVLDKKLFKVNKKYFLKDKKVVGDFIRLPIIERVGKAKLVKVKLDVL